MGVLKEWLSTIALRQAVHAQAVNRGHEQEIEDRSLV